MASDRLTALALLNIHKDIALDIDKALQDFDASGHHRILFSFEKVSLGDWLMNAILSIMRWLKTDIVLIDDCEFVIRSLLMTIKY